MVGKKGFLRVVEAVIGILIVIGFLIVLIGRNKTDFPEFESDGKIILDELASNETFREMILNGSDNSALRDFVKARINNPSLNFTLKICSLEGACSFNGPYPNDSEFYAAERIVSTNLRSEEFSPRRIKLFIWRIG